MRYAIIAVVLAVTAWLVLGHHWGAAGLTWAGFMAGQAVAAFEAKHWGDQ